MLFPCDISLLYVLFTLGRGGTICLAFILLGMYELAMIGVSPASCWARRFSDQNKMKGSDRTLSASVKCAYIIELSRNRMYELIPANLYNCIFINPPLFSPSLVLST